MDRSISDITKNDLCLGCGICQDACSKNAISIVRGVIKNTPFVNQRLCVDCGACLKVCPGSGIDIKKRSEELYQGVPVLSDYYLGRYVQCYTGFSNEYEIRYHSASGGCLSQFLIYLLDCEIIDGAVVTGYKRGDATSPYTYIARSREEVLAGRSSKYCPVSFEMIATQIMKLQGSYVIVGLPCHVHGFRKYEKIYKHFKEKIVGYFSLYCSSGKGYHSLDWFLKKKGIDKYDIFSFSYRDEGCLGSMKIVDTCNNVTKIPYFRLLYSYA